MELIDGYHWKSCGNKEYHTKLHTTVYLFARPPFPRWCYFLFYLFWSVFLFNLAFVRVCFFQRLLARSQVRGLHLSDAFFAQRTKLNVFF